jgi:hypothetical protein
LIVKLYNFAKNGNLPDEGGVMDQTNKFIDAFTLIDSLSRESDNGRK